MNNFQMTYVALVGAIVVPMIIGSDFPGIALGVSMWFTTSYRHATNIPDAAHSLLLSVVKSDLAFQSSEFMRHGFGARA